MNALWFILVVAFVLAMQANLYKKYIFKDLKIERKFENPAIFPGEKTTLRITLVNKKIFPITYLKLQQKIPVELQMVKSSMVENNDKVKYFHTTVLSMMPFQRITRKFEIVGIKRGVYNLFDPVKVFSTDLFGSEEYESEILAHARLVVYPNLIDLNSSFVVADSLQGDVFVRRWIIEDPIMISGIRDYTPSDNYKDINWKATAKNQTLKVNKYDYTADKKIMILFNIDFHRYLFKTIDLQEFEKAVEVAASLSVDLLKKGIPVGFSTNAICLFEGDYSIIEPSAGESQISKLLEVFAGLSFFKRYDLEEILRLMTNHLSWGTDLVVVTPFVDDKVVNALSDIGNTKISIVSIKPNEIGHLPTNIKLFFYNEEGKQLETVG
jgi:uncharacterized protein (DUF58 family)